MNLENIRAFIVVYQYQSFQKAAKQLFITQPTLSSRIRSLENDLETELFNRSKIPVTLTKDGQIFLPYALQIIRNYDQALQDIRVPKVLKIGSIASFSEELLPKALQILRVKYPQVIPSIIDSNSLSVGEYVLNGTCDFAIRHAKEDKRFDHIQIYEEPIRCIVSSNHYMAKADRIYSLNEIFCNSIIRLDFTLDYWGKLEYYAKEHQLHMNVEYRANHFSSVVAMVKENIGISFLPEIAVCKEIANGNLCSIRYEPDLHLTRVIECISSKNSKSEFMMPFIQILQSILKNKI